MACSGEGYVQFSDLYRVGGTQKGGFQKGGLADVPPERKVERGYVRMFPQNEKPERGYVRMFPRNENQNEGTFAKTTFYEAALLLGHTPSTAGTFRKKFRRSSGKTPEML